MEGNNLSSKRSISVFKPVKIRKRVVEKHFLGPAELHSDSKME